MKAMLLAAGRGERMRPLTDHTPKPLLKAGGRMLIEYHLEALARAGFRDVVINHAHLGAQVEAALGDGSHWGMRIHWSPESAGALETGGGIQCALPLLGEDAFVVINADIFCDFDPATLAPPAGLAHLVLVPNPAHHPDGDFSLAGDMVGNTGVPRYTFGGMGVYRPALFDGHGPGRFGLAPLLRAAADQGQVSGQLHRGRWMDIGTPARLAELDVLLAGTSVEGS